MTILKNCYFKLARWGADACLKAKKQVSSILCDSSIAYNKGKRILALGVIGVSTALAAPAQALDGHFTLNRDFGSCTVSIASTFAFSTMTMSMDRGLTLRSGGSFWSSGNYVALTSSDFTAHRLQFCVPGSSASEFNITYNNGAETNSTRARDDGLGLTFTFRGSTYDYRLIGVTGTIATATENTVDFPAPLAPELDVSSAAGADILDGSTFANTGTGTDFGHVDIGGSNTSQFRVTNSGTGVLTFGADAVAISGVHTRDFSITTDLPDNGTLAAGATASFAIQFSPTRTGFRRATVEIGSDDADENPYTFNLIGFGVVPRVTSLDTPRERTHKAGENLEFSLELNQDVVVDTSGNVPSIDLTIGSVTRQASFTGGSGSNRLSFAYQVQSGDLDTDGITINAVNLNGSTIRNSAGVDATLSGLTSIFASTPTILVDGVVPDILSIVRKTPAEATTDADSLVFTINFSENVTGVGADDFFVTGTTTATATSVVGSGSSYDVTVSGGDLISFEGFVSLGVDDRGNNIQDDAGNALNTLSDFTNEGYTLNNVSPQTISFPPPPPPALIYGDVRHISATSDSGLPVTLSTPSSTICEVNGSQVRAIGAGICVLRANQAGNASFSAAAQVTFNLGIGTRDITVTPNTQSKNYGDTLTLDNTAFSITSGSLLSGESIDTVALASAGDVHSDATANAATYANSIITRGVGTSSGGFNAANYNITFGQGDFVVNRRPITVSATAQSKSYGDMLTLDNTAVSVSPALPNGEGIASVTMSSATGVDASAVADVATFSNEIVISGPVSGIGSSFLESNYDITFVPGDLVVNKQPITLTASTQSKAYGDALSLDGSAFTVTSGSLVNGETIDTVALLSASSIHRDTGAHAATYANNIRILGIATSSNGFNENNYDIQYGTGDLEVKKRPITITANTQQKEFGASYSISPNVFTILDKDGDATLPNRDRIVAIRTVSTGGFGRDRNATVGIKAGDLILDEIVANSPGLEENNYDITWVAGDFVVVDTTAPTIRLGALTATGAGTYTSTITLSEPAANGTAFDRHDLVIGNGVASLSGSGTTFSALVAPNADGQVTLDVAAGAFQDASGNDNAVAARVSINHDGTRPTVSIAALTATGNGTYTAAITLSEAAGNGTAFEQTDLYVDRGTASLSGSGTSFTATITPTSDGTVSILVNPGAFTDAAGNSNRASGQTSITHDGTAPTITLGALTAVGDGTYTSAITLSEVDNGNLLQQSDLTVGNGSATLSGTGTSRTATITPTADFAGTVTLDVAAGAFTDAAGNNNTATTQVSIVHDGAAPTITLGALTAVGDGTYTSAITLSEVDNGNLLQQSDLAVGNGSATLSGTGTSRTATITPTADFAGTVTLDVASGAFTDAAGNNNTAATQVSIVHDGAAPTITLGALTAVGDGTYTSAITLSEADSGNLLQQSDLTVGNGSATLSGTGTSRTATITPTADFAGTVTLDVASGAFTDAAGNNNTAATQVSVIHDGTAPTITLGAITGPVNGKYSMTITLSEEPANGTTFDADDVTVQNGTATMRGSGLTRTLEITPAGNGPLSVSVAAGKFTDAAGNAAVAGTVTGGDTQVSVVHDGTAPTVVLGELVKQSDDTYTLTITLSEEAAAGSSFDVGDLILTNATATLSGSGTSFTANLTAIRLGQQLAVSVPANAFTDAASNGNLASNNVSVLVDAVKQAQQLISNVVQSNARMILQNQPNFTRRLDRLEGRAGRTGSLSAFGLNVTNSGLPFDAKIGREGGSFSFSLNRARQKQGLTAVGLNPLSAASSLGIRVRQDDPVEQGELNNRVLQYSQNRNAEYAQQRIDQAHGKPFELDGEQNSAAQQKEEQAETSYGLVNSGGLLQSGLNAGEAPELPRYDFWLEGTVGRQSVEDGRANFAIVHAGADYLLTPVLLLGLGAQFDWTSFEANSAALNANAKSDGFGFMVGPYLTTKLNENLYFDARVSWGQSYNDVSPLGTFEDDVTTDRFLTTASLIGQMQWDEVTIRPQVRASYYRAETQAYTDSLGVAVPGSILETGTLEFGPSFEKSYDIGDSFVFTPKFSFDGVWTFAERNTTPAAIARSNDGLSGRVQAGVDLTSSDGFTLSLSGRYDGIGQSDYEVYSGSVRISHRW